MFIRKIITSIAVSFIVFVTLFVLSSPVFAQSCSGYVTNCCSQTTLVNVPEGCKASCATDPNPYCVQCTKEVQCVEYEEVSCNDSCGSSCISGIQDLCHEPPGSGLYCGDGICSDPINGCSTCPQDCGVCAPVCGDGACNGTETIGSCPADCGGTVCGDAVCEGTENCNNCGADCGSCGFCGDLVCSANEGCDICVIDCGVCSSGPFCGDGICQTSNGENCTSCAADCGTCVNFCGDGTCAGTESCLTCSSDCGACSTSGAWWQVQGGLVGAENTNSSSIAIGSSVPDDDTCIGTCIPGVSITDLAGTALSDGFPIFGSGVISANGYVTERDPNVYASGTRKTRFSETYEFFYRNSNLGLSPADDFAGQENDAQQPVYNALIQSYYSDSSLTIQSPWTVTSGEHYVIFVNGDLTLTDGDGSSDELIDVEVGGFLAFIVNGDITVEESLGNSTLTDLTPNLEGVYIADGTLTIESRGVAGGGDDRFVGAGVFVGWSGVSLDRDYDDGGARAAENNDKPAETFLYRPDFLINMPNSLLFPIRIWQEVNPTR